MSETGNLYKNMTVRFSLINDQHVKNLQKLENLSREKGKPKNQIIMDAVEQYFGTMDSGMEGMEETDAVRDGLRQYAAEIKASLKEEIKNEVRQELLRELFGAVAGIAPRAGLESVRAAPEEDGGTDAGGEDVVRDDYMEELKSDPGIVESAMKWG
jgi:predicted DNA-binding protein